MLGFNPPPDDESS